MSRVNKFPENSNATSWSAQPKKRKNRKQPALKISKILKGKK